VALDAKGRVPPFNFIGQSWPDVLQWLANISKCSLDWQELPADYLNLTTQRSYALDEVRDLVNRQLHARGYTMLTGGEVLSVFKIEKLDPSLVPRVTEDDLFDLKPYDFVKVSFELPERWLPTRRPRTSRRCSAQREGLSARLDQANPGDRRGGEPAAGERAVE